MCVCVCVCVCSRVFVCVCVCIILIHTYTYVHIYVYTHINKVWMYGFMDVCRDTFSLLYTHTIMYGCMGVWMYVGDILIAVDRRRATTSGEVKRLIMGERGTSVALAFERRGHVFEVTLLRERVWGAYSFTLADQALMSSKV